ncbi:MAG: hypothetical protein ABW128_19370 [Rhizorhabdus sp.]
MIYAAWKALPYWLKVGIPVLAIIAILVLIAALWPEDRTAEQQAIQTTRSAEAISKAAGNAIETIGDQVATEDRINVAVTQAAEEIDSAETADAVRDVVLERLCGTPAHINDAACAMHRTNP